MTSPEDQRTDLQAAAARIEAETRGQLPASAFDHLIDAQILPNARGAELERLLPISVCADRTGTPTTLDRGKPRVGAIAVYAGHVVLAWETVTMVSNGTAGHVVDRGAITAAEAWRDAKTGLVGIDVREGRARWSLVTAGSMPQTLTQPWVEDLSALLGGAAAGETGARIAPETLQRAVDAVNPAAPGAGTEALLLRRLVEDARAGRGSARSLDTLVQHADERLAELGEEPYLWSDQGERRAWVTVRELLLARA